MPKMQTARVLVDLGGDSRNSVPKWGVTVAEIAVLGVIHGEDAVHDIVPDKYVDLKAKDELARLREKYGRAVDGDGDPLINQVYPGRNPRLHYKLEELELAEELYAPAERVKPSATPKVKSKAKAPAKNDVME